MWKIFPGDLDLTLDWTPETDLELEELVDDVSSHALVSTRSRDRVRVIHADESWPVQQVKNVLKDGSLSLTKSRRNGMLLLPCLK
jgi:hypothetical protein